ncbi:phosphatidate cytidylyltransferase [Malaciobacter marinus]|uniref:phosphatidate cytidylyltransferase n=1 Tax=Malaciobacter marinus TaxID=505249 RepID=UPI000C072659|nr:MULTISPECIES: phosphatidate cytidylyltransferase [Malaciobacter]PHO12584.1 phosphatidate cytidylyltransferase [Malaciobacter marinus]RYA22505.1 phosphatidate cytidylyltransferase [Malaciobacter halophilus]
MSNLIKDSSTRIKTALVLFFVFILVSYFDIFFITWLFLGFFMIVGVSEAMKLFQVKSYIVYQIALISWLIAYFYKDSENLIFLALVIIASVLAYTKDIDKKTFLPLLYPLASFLILLSLYNDFGIQILWWILFIVATTDTGAYFIGKSIGKTKFCQTSPNKTLEGVIAGVIFGSLIGALFAISNISYFQAFLISFIVAIASIFGDLFESYLKREAKVKDSGDILPGHGGVLDRTDGYLFASVVMLVVLRAAV